MKPWTSWFARLGLAGSCLLWVGCGGGNVPDPDSDSNAATGPAAGAAAAPPPLVAQNDAPAPAPAAAPAPEAAGNPAPAANAPAEAAPAVAEDAAAPEGSEEKAAAKSEAPSATNEMLALAAVPAASEKEAEGAEKAAAPGQGGMMPGMMPGSYPGASGTNSGPAMDPRMMNPGLATQAAGYPGAGGAGASGPGAINDPRNMGGAGMPGMPGMGGAGMPGGNNAKPDFRNPMTAVNSFLQAVRAKDPERLAEATALHAGQATETKANYQKVFLSIIEQSLAPEDLDELAKKFEGVQIMGQNEPKSSGRCDVIVGKMEGNDTITRAVSVRKEKSGWKVVDIGGARKIPSQNMMPSGGRRR